MTTGPATVSGAPDSCRPCTASIDLPGDNTRRTLCLRSANYTYDLVNPDRFTLFVGDEGAGVA
jgi:hypothetical protein